MVAAFASVLVAEELGRGTYPLLSELWDYRSTPVPHDSLAALRSEIVELVKGVSRDSRGQEVIDELDGLPSFLKGVEKLGLGIHVDGP